MDPRLSRGSATARLTFTNRGMKRRSDIERLHDEINELIDELWHVPRFAGARRGFRPHVDCVRRDDPAELHVFVELPGVEPAAIQVAAAEARYEQGVLKVVLPIAAKPPKRERVSIAIGGRK